MPVKKLTAKQKLLNWLHKQWANKKEGFTYIRENKAYRPQSMGFICLNDGTYYPMPQSPVG